MTLPISNFLKLNNTIKNLCNNKKITLIKMVMVLGINVGILLKLFGYLKEVGFGYKDGYVVAN